MASSSSAAAGSSARKITLKSSDGEEFVIDEAVALESQTLKNLIDDDCAGSAIPLPNVNSSTLAKVLEWCVRHVEAAPEPDCELGEKEAKELKEWDARYVNLDQTTLFELILAANYLNIKGLMDVTCQKVADDIKGKSPEEIRIIFNIKNDYTKEEEEEVRRENAWAFE